MKKIFKILLLIFVSIHAQALDCKKVRMADIGWTDVSATTALSAELLKALGYDPEIALLATSVSFAALKNNDIDVFLGNWMPSMEADIRPFLSEGSLVQLQQNLSGARFSLAVPHYVYDSGVRSVSDLSKYAPKFGQKIYGLEAGNDGNRLILSMIAANAFALGNFAIVESSEQGMLMSVKNAIAEKAWIVFLGWSPHPMNISLDLEYLSGADEYFGKNYGASAVYTVVRKDLEKECPALTTFLKKLVFDTALENELMQLILEEKMSPQKAALSWLQSHPEKLKTWLDKAQIAQLHKHIKAAVHKNKSIRIPVGDYLEKYMILFIKNFSKELRSFSAKLESLIKSFVAIIININDFILLFILVTLSFILRKSIFLSLAVLSGLLLIIAMNLWVETIETLVLVLLAASISIAIGVPLGIASAHSPSFYRVLRPVLDLMQTIPTFIYLIPTLMLFGIGIVPGLISTVIFAIAAPIRLTYLGIMSLPDELKEVGLSFGANAFERLIKIELPHALPSIRAGLSQCIMLSLSMVVIAALVGADGLGEPVIRALNTVNMSQGFESGLAIVIIAIILDRTLSMPSEKS